MYKAIGKFFLGSRPLFKPKRKSGAVMQTLEKVGNLHNSQKLFQWISSVRREWGILGSILQRYLATPGGGQKGDREFLHEVFVQEQESPWAHTLTKLACVVGIQQGRGKEFGLTSAGGDKTGEDGFPSLPPLAHPLRFSRARSPFRLPFSNACLPGYF